MKKIRISKGAAKCIAIILSILMLIPTVMMFGEYGKEKTIRASSLNKEDLETATQISNITGIKVEDITSIKAKGYSWNEVLEQCKKNKINSSSQLTNAMETASMSDENIKKLKAEGFSSNDINASKLIAERVQLQLKELTDSSINLPKQSTTLIDSQSSLGNQSIDNSNNNISSNNDEEIYKELQDKFDFQKAIYLMLKLKKDFGSFEQVLNEYLYDIQIGVDLEQYILDKKKYEEEKANKSASVDKAKLLTLAKLEEKILSKIQVDNQKYNPKTLPVSDSSKNNPYLSGNATNSGSSSQSPVPDVSNNGVKNPADSIMQEIKDINSKSLNMDGR
jgi:hypothetical protein